MFKKATEMSVSQFGDFRAYRIHLRRKGMFLPAHIRTGKIAINVSQNAMYTMLPSVRKLKLRSVPTVRHNRKIFIPAKIIREFSVPAALAISARVDGTLTLSVVNPEYCQIKSRKNCGKFASAPCPEAVSIFSFGARLGEASLPEQDKKMYMSPKLVLNILIFVSVGREYKVESLKKSPLELLFINHPDPALCFNAIELICDEGYPVQQHKVISADGYLINLHRIPNGNRKRRVNQTRRGYLNYHHHVHPDFYVCANESMYETTNGPPVLLQHGLLVASDSWVLQGAGLDLVYLLADAGYDVWLSDARGNFYSRENLYKSPKSKDFWDYSFHEIASKDMPAVIDYLLHVTNQKQIYYIGHSMGTTIYFVMGATRPEYMSKVRLSVLLAPVANLSLSLIEPPKGTIMTFLEKVLHQLERQQNYEIATRAHWLPFVANHFCSKNSPLQDICYDFALSLDGYPYHNTIRKNFARMVSHFMSGTTIKIFFHYIQIARTRRFQHYDYGPEENFKRYHQATPPEYDQSRITNPTALIYSETDLFVDAEQVEHLAEILPNVVYAKKLTNFLHTDFIIANNAKEKLYYDVIDLMKKY